MTDALNEARKALQSAEEPEIYESRNPDFLVQIAIANALIALTQEVGKVGLLLRKRLPK